jgi:hypothetical protein
LRRFLRRFLRRRFAMKKPERVIVTIEFDLSAGSVNYVVQAVRDLLLDEREWSPFMKDEILSVSGVVTEGSQGGSP